MKATTEKSFWSRVERVERLRFNSEDRAMARLERLERQAAPMIGELASGKFYTFPVGGKYFESYSQTEVVKHLAKKGYIHA